MTAAYQERSGPRLYVEPDLAAGAHVELGSAQTHYLRNVMRLGPGAGVLLFNGRDGEWSARIKDVHRNGCTLSAEQCLRRQQTEADVWLVFAPVKRARLDFIARHTTELGVAVLWPVYTQRCVVRRVNRDRLLANAIEAAEQSDRLTVPEIFPPVPLAQAIDAWPEGRRLYLCDETGGGRPVGDVFSEAPVGPAAILCGPEGGFAAAELDALRKRANVTSVGLGPRVLRAETAAFAALACWQALAGDWRRSAGP